MRLLCSVVSRCLGVSITAAVSALKLAPSSNPSLLTNQLLYLCNRGLSFRILAALALAGLAFSQPPQVPTGGQNKRIVAPDHPELYFAFLSSHVRQGAEIARQKASNRLKGDAIELKRASSLGLNIAELKQLDKRTNDFDQSIKKLDLDFRKELDAAEKGKRQADPVALRRLDAQRYLAIVAAMHQVRSDLPPASWNRLKTFVNQRYRPGVRVLEVKK